MDERKGHPPRLQHWDYARAGAYFVTIKVADRQPVLSRIDPDRLVLSPAGAIVDRCWRALPDEFAVRLDSHVIMPDHVHAIIHLRGDGTGAGRSMPMMSAPGVVLGKVIRAWKARSTIEIRRAGMPGFAWQSRFYERVIRHRDELDQTRIYIVQNPVRWLGSKDRWP